MNSFNRNSDTSCEARGISQSITLLVALGSSARAGPIDARAVTGSAEVAVT
jgi:hypothetical protein